MKIVISTFVLFIILTSPAHTQKKATFSIDSTTLIFGRTCYVFNQSNPGQLNWTDYLEVVNDTVWRCGYKEPGKEPVEERKILTPLFPALSSTWWTNFGGSARCSVKTNQEIITPAGTFASSILEYTDSVTGAYIGYMALSEGVGMVAFNQVHSNEDDTAKGVLESYSIIGGEGVLPIAVGNQWILIPMGGIIVTKEDMQRFWKVGQTLVYHEAAGPVELNIGQNNGPNIYDFTDLTYFRIDSSIVRSVATNPILSLRFPDSAFTFYKTSDYLGGVPIMLFKDNELCELGNVKVYADTQRYRHYNPSIDRKLPWYYGWQESFSIVNFETTYVAGNPTQIYESAWSATSVIDGYGTLLIPGYNLECLRLKYIQGERKAFQFYSREGAFFWVETDTAEPDTGNILASRCSYYMSGSLVNVSNSQLIPDEFYLYNNHPNPFNPSTTVNYQLPMRSKINLKIYNTLGQLVTTLIDKVEEAGFKSVEWNATNVASGVYFYHLEATSLADPGKTFTQVKKLLLVR